MLLQTWACLVLITLIANALRQATPGNPAASVKAFSQWASLGRQKDWTIS